LSSSFFVKIGIRGESISEIDAREHFFYSEQGAKKDDLI
jgi:hypothetical protein